MGMPQGVGQTAPFSHESGYDEEEDTFSELEQSIFEFDNEAVKGWSKNQNGQYGNLYTRKFTKDGKVVHAVNTSPHESVGYLCPAYFADKKEDLESFFSDMGLSASIKEGQALVQHQ